MIEVRAEITASVLQVCVAVGDTVAVGDMIAILESMKMEIPVTSPTGGTVVSVYVADGEDVLSGDKLADVE